MWIKEETICVHMVGEISHYQEIIPGIRGFVVYKDTKSCFLEVSNNFNLELENHHGDVLELFMDVLLNSNDENAIDFSDEIRTCEETIVFNFQEIFPEMIAEILATLGEKD